MIARPRPAAILTADWAKDSAQRAVWTADGGDRLIRRVAPPAGGWALSSLLAEASERAPGPVLVALDLVLGVPAAYFSRRHEVAGWERSSSFLDWLPRAAATPGFFETAASAREWSVARPFFSVPRGRGAFRAFAEAATFDLRRAVDRRCGGKPVFAVSGIPGSVGSASRALWRELAPRLEVGRTFRVWPFEGDLGRLLGSAPAVVAEIYPRLAYAVAVAPELPARLAIPRRKGDRAVREDWLSRLSGAPWRRRFGVAISDEAVALSSEDDFDALFAAAALLRCLLENLPLASAPFDPRAEGGILGSRAASPRPSPGSAGQGLDSDIATL